MAVQRKSQIPKAPERDLLDSIVDAPARASGPALTLAPSSVSPEPAATAIPAALTPEPAPPAIPVALPPESTARPESTAGAIPQTLHPPVRRQRKPKREVYTSKMDPDLKAWAMSFKPEEDFVEVVEQAVWILRLARVGKMDEAVAALEQASQPLPE